MKKTVALVAGVALLLALVAVGGASSARAQSAGCTPGNAYDIYTGAACPSTMAGVPEGCFPGYVYSITTGDKCPILTTSSPTAAGPIFDMPVAAATPGFPNTGIMPVSDLVIPGILMLALAAGAAYTLRRVQG